MVLDKAASTKTGLKLLRAALVRSDRDLRKQVTPGETTPVYLPRGPVGLVPRAEGLCGSELVQLLRKLSSLIDTELQKLVILGGGGTGEGWRYLFQRARHFRGEGKGKGKWGTRIHEAEEVGCAAPCIAFSLCA